jgi:hypothetical protein
MTFWIVTEISNSMQSLLLQKLMAAQLLKKIPAFIESEMTSLCSQDPVIDLIESQSNSFHILTLCFRKIQFNIILLIMLSPSF